MNRMAAMFLTGALAFSSAPTGAVAATSHNYPNTPVRTGSELGEFCSATPDGAMGTAALNLCHGYARGAVSAYTQLQAGSRYPLKLFCLPPTDTISASAVLLEFATWVKGNPAQGQERAVDALFSFLGIKFPCGK